MALKLFYKKAAAHCCGEHHQLSTPDFNNILDDVARQLWDAKMSGDSIHPELYKQTANTLMKAVWEGLGAKSFSYESPMNELGAYLQQNTHAFSAVKSMYQMQHFAKMMTIDGKKVESFTAFRNKVLDAGFEINKNWLQSEYNTALAGAEMARKWEELKESKVEYLEYSTVGDSHVREKHKLLDKFTARISDTIWRTIYPPNGWNCRCTVVPGKAQNASAPLPDYEPKEWKDKHDIDVYFQRNVGREKVIFKEDGPIYEIEGNKKPRQVLPKHYNMQTVQELLTQNKWPMAKGFDNPQDAKDWIKQQPKTIKSILGVELKMEKGFDHFIDRSDDRHLFAKEFINVLEAPDEVWATKVKGKIDWVFLKYYDGLPLVVRVNDKLEYYTFHSLLNGNTQNFEKMDDLNNKQIINIRKGTLLFNKK